MALGRSNADAALDEHAVWQDREIRFDAQPAMLGMRGGETAIASIDSVEDTKGNNGEKGSLSITNLRLIWRSQRSSRTSMSIGYNCVLSVNVKAASSRLRGSTQALHVMTKHAETKFEFVFTNLALGEPRLFTLVQEVLRLYETSRLYRELKLRAAIIRDKALLLLPKEQVFTRISGIWNLSSDQGNLGTFYVTNVRLVWHANLAENFNVSMPYLQIRTLRQRDSKFGPALVVETRAEAGSYVLGFRVDPVERLGTLLQELLSLHSVYAAAPLFGVDCALEGRAEAPADAPPSRGADDVEIVDGAEGGDAAETVSAYYAELDKSSDRPPVYNRELGLAMEELPDGVTPHMLWALV